MQIGQIKFPITALGINNRLGIWTVGCNRRCPNCISPNFQLADVSREIEVKDIIELVRNLKFEGVTISGGEPFLQIKELRKLVQAINEELHIDDILIFTGFLKKELDERKDEDIDYIFKNISVLIDGPYIDELNTNLVLRGSSNQTIYFLKEKYQPLYEKYMNEEKKFDTFWDDEHSFTVIGIPDKELRKGYKYIPEGEKKDE